MQLIGASLYAYIVGVASGIVASMNKVNTEILLQLSTLECSLT